LATGFQDIDWAFPGSNWIWSYDQELDLELERFLKGYDLLRINYVFGNWFLHVILDSGILDFKTSLKKLTTITDLLNQ
jgi:hypothetical protein